MQKPLRGVGRLGTGESESARGTMGRGKSGREAPTFSFFPSSIARSPVFFFFFFFFFLMLPSLLEYPAAASAKEDLIIPRGRYFSGRSPRIRHRMR